ncbi:MAG: hypothetical protein, partial [Olavius algarvensis Gamma 1 endosymbiont]
NDKNKCRNKCAFAIGYQDEIVYTLSY